jgi:hypothetical protein
MDVTGVGSRFGLGVPSTKDLAAILAARPSMAELAAKAMAATGTGPDAAEDDKNLGAPLSTNKVDMYL